LRSRQHGRARRIGSIFRPPLLRILAATPIRFASSNFAIAIGGMPIAYGPILRNASVMPARDPPNDPPK
jgi:hypothetical protein